MKKLMITFEGSEEAMLAESILKKKVFAFASSLLPKGVVLLLR